VIPRVAPATRDHLDSVVRIERDSFSDPWSQDAFAGMIDSPFTLFLVALSDDGRVIGYVAAAGVHHDGEIFNVAVDPLMRGQGIGGILLDFVIAALGEQLVGRVFLEVRESNGAAIALYESRGFERLSVRKNYYRKPVENALVLQLELKKSN
jgi:ribosomal-protein-alanine N-acetyltransferase